MSNLLIKNAKPVCRITGDAAVSQSVLNQPADRVAILAVELVPGTANAVSRVNRPVAVDDEEELELAPVIVGRADEAL